MAMTETEKYKEYLRIISNPDFMRPLTKIEFLNPDDTVAYALDGTYKRRYGYPDSRAFLQDGTINVSLNNGQRRTASIRFENLDNAFDYAINKLWFGRRVRLLKGVTLKDGSEFYISQGIFYLNSPKTGWKPNSRTAEYSLVDKWAYLDGTLFGNLENTYEVPAFVSGSTTERTNIFEAMQGILQLSIFDHKYTPDKVKQVDNVKPIFTDYYNNRCTTINGQQVAMNLMPKTVTPSMGGTYGKVLLDLNALIAGWIGYDSNGALRVDASADDLNDADKPVMWKFDENSKTFFGLDETANPSQVFNDIIVWGENLDGGVVGARATNYDPTSDTNVNLIGLKTYVESSDINYTNEQCQALANWYLKRKTVLQKSVTISCSQMFHLQENNLISVLRSDKPGKPIEKHLIQAISIPLSEKGSCSITATSINDFPEVTEVSMGEFLKNQGEKT